MLYPSQLQAKDALRQNLEQSESAHIVQGLSGSGKSLIAQEALSEGCDGMVVEGAEVGKKVDDVKSAMKRKLRVIILSQPGLDVKSISEKVSVSANIVSVKGLAHEEVETWLESLQPECAPEEREHVLRYSLGIPLLIERMCAMRPVTAASGVTQCTLYLQNLIESCQLHGDVRDQSLAKILDEYTAFAIPEDVLANLADWEWVRRSKTPMSILHSQLYKEADLPVPQSSQLFELYREWLKRIKDEPSFDVFVEELQDPERIVEDIGYCSFPERDVLLKSFVQADTRKGATYFAPERRSFSKQMDNLTVSDHYLDSSLMTLARTTGAAANLNVKMFAGRELVDVKLPDHPNAFYLHKHDHEHTDVMPVAYTIECYLQQLGVAYTVKYNDEIYCYRPDQKRYDRMESVKVDYYGELVPKLEELEN